jgi:hypothetical protein
LIHQELCSSFACLPTDSLLSFCYSMSQGLPAYPHLLLPVHSQQTPFPRLLYQLTSGWVWPMGATVHELEGKSTGESRIPPALAASGSISFLWPPEYNGSGFLSLLMSGLPHFSHYPSTGFSITQVVAVLNSLY